MADLKELEKKIKDKGIKKQALAAQLGVSYKTFWRKLSGQVDFKTTEASNLAELLNLTEEEKANIFLERK